MTYRSTADKTTVQYFRNDQPTTQLVDLITMRRSDGVVHPRKRGRNHEASGNKIQRNRSKRFGIKLSVLLVAVIGVALVMLFVSFTLASRISPSTPYVTPPSDSESVLIIDKQDSDGGVGGGAGAPISKSATATSKNNDIQQPKKKKENEDLCNLVLVQDSDLVNNNMKSDEKCCLMARTSKLPKPFEIAVHCHDSIVSQTIITDGSWEDGITERISHVLEHLLSPQKEGQNGFLDVGGNVGYFSLLAASLGYSVVTFEPMLYNTRLIRRSQRINPHLDITLVDRALVSEEMFSKDGIKSVCFDMPKGNADNGIVKLDDGGNNRRDANTNTDCKTYAQTTTIDRATVGIKAATKAMKMDIEGFEGHALAGASRLLKEIKPCYIWFEYQRDAISGDPSQLLNILSDANYEIKDIDPKLPKTFTRHVGGWNTPKSFFGEARHLECASI